MFIGKIGRPSPNLQSPLPNNIIIIIIHLHTQKAKHGNHRNCPENWRRDSSKKKEEACWITHKEELIHLGLRLCNQSSKLCISIFFFLFRCVSVSTLLVWYWFFFLNGILLFVLLLEEKNWNLVLGLFLFGFLGCSDWIEKLVSSELYVEQLKIKLWKFLCT